jgi:hypothetical protein
MNIRYHISFIQTQCTKVNIKINYKNQVNSFFLKRPSFARTPLAGADLQSVPTGTLQNGTGSKPAPASSPRRKEIASQKKIKKYNSKYLEYKKNIYLCAQT